MTVHYQSNSLGIIGNINAMCRREAMAKSYHVRRRPKTVLPWFSPRVRERMVNERHMHLLFNSFFSRNTARPFWPANRKANLC